VDADDTLWENSIYYQRAGERFQEYMAQLGCAPQEALLALRRAELDAVPTHGYGPQGYCQALEEACRQLLERRGLAASASQTAAARAIGNAILDVPIELLPGVRATLEALRPDTWLCLVTKGDHAAQRRKIERSGLAPLFDAVYVEPEKNAALYRRIVREHALDPAHTQMVGNSPRSDVNEAVRAGLVAIHVPHPATWVAEVEPIEAPDRVVTLATFADLVTLRRSIEGKIGALP
jgi:putative hydrolase of the HAD superfamily